MTRLLPLQSMKHHCGSRNTHIGIRLVIKNQGEIVRPAIEHGLKRSTAIFTFVIDKLISNMTHGRMVSGGNAERSQGQARHAQGATLAKPAPGYRHTSHPEKGAKGERTDSVEAEIYSIQPLNGTSSN